MKCDDLKGRLWRREGPVYGLLLLVFLAGCTCLRNTDLWWHLRTGQLILERGALPQTDWFTYTEPQASWIDLNWLWQLLCVGAWNAGGLPALIVLTSLIGTATFGLLVLGTARAGPVSWAAMLWLLPAVMLFSERYPVRPEILSFLYLSLTLVVCYGAADRPRLIFLLPAIQVLWVNTHGSFVLQWAVAGFFLIAAVARRLLPRLREVTSDDTHAGRWLLALLLCAGASLINPYGVRGVLLVRVLASRLGSGETAVFYKTLSGELASVWDARNPVLAGLAGVVLAVAVLSFFPPLVQRRVSMARILLLGSFAFLGLQSMKNLSYLAIVAAAVVDWNMADGPRDAVRRAWRDGKFINFLGAAAVMLLIVAVPTNYYYEALGACRPPSDRKQFGWAEQTGLSPHAEAQFLGAPQMPRRVFAWNHALAAACIFHNGPQRQVFADGRLEVVSRQQYQRGLRIEALLVQADPRAEQELLAAVPPDARGQQEMPALLLDLETCAMHRKELLHHPRWRPVFMGAAAVAFLYEPDAQRLGLAGLDIEKADELLVKELQRHCRTPADFQCLLGRSLVRSDVAEAVRCFEAAIRLRPQYVEAHYDLALAVEGWQPELAEEHYRLALQYRPTYAQAHNNYANLLLRRKEYGQAIDHYRRALELNPSYHVARQNLAVAQRLYSSAPHSSTSGP